MRLAVLAATVLAAPSLAFAQSTPGTAMPGMAMSAMKPAGSQPSVPPAPGADPHVAHHGAAPPAPTMDAMAGMPAREPGARHAGMDMSAQGMTGAPGMHMGHMQGALAAYPMARDASGTAWQPDSSPMDGFHGRTGDWSTMVHGYATLVYDDQGGPRGDAKTFVESMLMGMAQRPLAGGTLTLRGMGSLDPFMGKRGYPLLFQTGETANGRTQLTDRQHPHDLFMELAAVYSRPLTDGLSGFLYLAPVGEPALGPATYMHRFSGIANPEAPIGHHWLDSSHITFGVVTAGVVYDRWKLEASSFTGREPNQNRYDLDHPRFDSWSVRASWNPTPDWSLQVSRGHLNSPEQLEPEVNQDRTTASATYNKALRGGGDWQTTLAWGRDENSPGHTTDAFLLDSAVSIGRHTVFGRAETVDKDELFANDLASPLRDRSFHVSKFSAGYLYTLPVRAHLALDLGGLVSKYAFPSALDGAYGSDPTSFMLFTRIKITG